MELEKEKMRRERAERMKSRAKERQEQIQQKEESKKIAEVEKLKKKEARESIKLERDKERVKIREEKRKYAERLKMWSKRRDDMECDDLKELPAATPVKTRLPPECFGDALMVSEFLHAFGDLFELKDEFPDGITFEMLEEALVGSDPEGPLCELLFFFLSAIFQAMCEEEEEVAKDHITEAEAKRLTEALGEGKDSATDAHFAVASLAAAWPKLNHGCSLKELDLDSCTLSEILRLLFLSSGADSNSASAKYRYQKQGGFVATDDACMELRLNHPAILKKLTTTSVYSLLPDEKLKILHALCGKLLTLVSTRDYIEDCVEELRQAKQEFRELKAEQNRKEREEAAARIRKRKEEKLKEQELKMKDKEDKLKEDENKEENKDKAAGNEEQGELQNGNENKDAEQKEQDAATEDEDVPPAGKKRKGMRGQNGGKEKNRDSLGNTQTELVDGEVRHKKEKREQDLIEKIQQVTACTNITPLGRDRWYRRFWTFFSVPGLFVEEDYTGITEDMLQPHPASHREPEINSAVNGHDGSVQEIKEETEAPKPVNKPNRWCYYSSVEQLEQLIECLNTRGHRESTLKDTLVQEKWRISQKLNNFPTELFNISENPPPEDKKLGRGTSSGTPDNAQTSGEKQLELRLCELLLDIEERIYQGSLGTVKVPDRQLWRAALEKCSYEFLEDEPKDKSLKVEDNEVEEMELDGKQSIEDGLQGIKNEDPSVSSTNASTPQPVANSVQYLARALLLIEKGVERKYLKAPLGDAEDTKKDSKSDKKKKEERKKKDEDQANEKDDTSESGRIQRTVLDRWRESLESSGSLSQIFLHLSTLDRSILWSRSILNFRCKVCRKKGDSESMLLCDGCERGHHIYCVRPKLKCIPDGEWLCPDCRPRSRRPGRPRRIVESEEEEEEENFAEEKLQGESKKHVVEEATMSEEEESPKKKRKPKVQLPLKIKGKPGPKKKSGRSPRSQQGTPPASKGRGKKAHSAPPQEKKVGARHSIHTSQPSAESHETSLLELVSTPGRGRGRGRGRGKKMKSVDNTPVGSPFAFRPFSLENSEQTPKGINDDSENLTPTRKGRGRGKKRLLEISSSDQGNRRSSGRHQGVHELSACEQLVVELVRHDDSWPFMRLVSKYQVPDYFDIIQKPIALNIIREKVNKCEYNSATEFIEDVQLMFSNCFEYNKVDSNEAKAGHRLQSFFVNEAEKLGLEVSCSKPIIPPVATKKSRI